ncbi:MULTISPECIES: anhydro-N-acetylmuramic acid kinase [Nonlabens]|uniref:Anhydro-N-acetylmuramic acid kinase n=2 Tax=Nonlabens ulvanivorans TaxID=906888 RepID=A0A084JYG9_NONUL|nr:anhydro-N-acetylmuramic acid kinase [Nonlabens ulvanivorans]KEZ94003.1 anhydro-N-acetylmuramic acid kinase [Nonlabens ulvanivorans]
MNHQCYNVIGVMSGTSLDAIDLVYVKLVRNDSWNFHVLKVKSIEYNHVWQTKLASAISLPNIHLKDLNNEYTLYLSQCINDFIYENQITELLAICSHGHTIHHQPGDGYTFQIGNLPILADLLSQRVVCDFRSQDVDMGGQGAPLVPIGDHFLFNKYDYCLNLGGFANISYSLNDIRKAFDIVPVNVVLNYFANRLGSDYDDSGAFAKAGKINSEVLAQLNSLPYYKVDGPKSLGVEWIDNHVWDIIKSIDNPLDALATYTEHVAMQISSVLLPESTVLVTGGGAYNSFLIHRISSYSKAEIIIPNKELIEYKEALIFAFLGVLKLRNENNCLASVTGASMDHSSGKIYLP